MRRVLTTACPLDCPDGCSLTVTVDDGRLTAVDADRSADANPMTQGFICQKVKHHARRVYAPERVLTPLIRTGAKGLGEFRPASWDEAVGLIAERIATSIATDGPSSVLPYLYSSSAGILAQDARTVQLFERLGCPEVTHTICAATVGAAWRQVYGAMLSADPLDVPHARLIVIWGANPNASNTHLTPLVNRAVKDGATLVVVDPRRTGVAGRADLHLPIRPGTDAVLAFAIADWLSANDGLDHVFIDAHVDGADEFVAAAREWPVDVAAEVCGVDPASIIRLAELIAQPGPSMLRLGWGLERNRNGGSGCLGAISLWALAGHFGERGSGILASTSGAAPIDLDRTWPTGVERPAREAVSMNDVVAALAGAHPAVPRTRVLVVQGANPAVTAMDQSAWLRELSREDLFTVVHDQVLTDTAAFADVVLPATTHFESADLATSYGSYSLQRVEPVIERVGESRTNDEAAAALAVALGLPADDFDPDPDRLAAVARTDASSTSRPSLRDAGGTVQFVDTFPSWAGRPGRPGRVRLHDPSSELPLPRHVAGVTSAGVGDGLTLLSPATNRTINSMFAEFDPPEAAISLHPDDASARGLADGDLARVFNHLGEIELIVRLDGVVRPGVASIPKGLWRRSFAHGSGVNALIPRESNDLAGGACFNDARVEVDKADVRRVSWP